MKTQPLFVIPDLPLENRRPEPVEEKPKTPPELPEKDQEGSKREKTRKKEEKIPPPDPLGQSGTKIDITI
jgi:hypothetical protein